MNFKLQNFDYVVLGAGIFGLYATTLLLQKGYRVALVERDSEPFLRASYVNQARLHYGYHYPRSIATAKQTIKYYKRFQEDFGFAINHTFRKIYAISSRISYTSSRQYLKFCKYLDIPAAEIDPSSYFNDGTIEAAFETEECAFDAHLIRDHFLHLIQPNKNAFLSFNKHLRRVEKHEERYLLHFHDGTVFQAPAVLNATYAGINQVLDKFNYGKFDIKYEIAEIIVCNVSSELKNAGLTVMDGPFLSVMPFGLTDCHTLSAVQYTPSRTSFDALPSFGCQARNPNCTPSELDNCNSCPARPSTAWKYMLQLSKKYLRPSIALTYDHSLFAIKPILTAAEIDDSRPTMIEHFSKKPSFISVLSGKINGIYELEKVLT